jgi:predicted CoA-binding protein
VAPEVLGAKAYRRLADIRVPFDLVNVFRRAEFIDEVVDECLRLQLKTLLIQEGIVNEPAARRARDGGKMVVMDRCIYRYFRSICS